jgi:hypothetical protein
MLTLRSEERRAIWKPERGKEERWNKNTCFQDKRWVLHPRRSWNLTSKETPQNKVLREIRHILSILNLVIDQDMI